MSTKVEPFRILVLSGGGIRGRFQCDFLNKLETQLSRGDDGKKLADSFDFVAGTSTGGIVAAAIVCRISMSSAVNLFDSRGKEIFSRNFRWLGPFSKRPPYDNSNLRSALDSIFGNKTIASIDKPYFAIPATQINAIRHHVFSNFPRADNYEQDQQLLLKDVVTASCSAPSFFQSWSPEAGEKRAFVDGGLWANDPSIVALTYAQKYAEIGERPIKLLSVGNGMETKGFQPQDYNNRSSLELVGPLLDIMFGCQESGGKHLCELILGETGFKSVNCELQSNIPLDDVSRANNELPPLATQLWITEQHRIMKFLEL